MRISDWSSDVCSSDLVVGAEHRGVGGHGALHLDADFRGRRTTVRITEMVETAEREVGAVLGQLGLRGAGLDQLLQAMPGGAAKDDEIDQAVRTPAVGAIDRKSTRLNSSH